MNKNPPSLLAGRALGVRDFQDFFDIAFDAVFAHFYFIGREPFGYFYPKFSAFSLNPAEKHINLSVGQVQLLYRRQEVPTQSQNITDFFIYQFFALFGHAPPPFRFFISYLLFLSLLSLLA